MRAGQLSLVRVAQARAAVAADVVEGGDAAVCAGQHDDLGIAHLAQEVASGRGELLRAAGAQPHVEMDPLHLELEVLRVGVVARGQGGHPRRHLRPDVGVRAFHAPAIIAGHGRGSLGGPRLDRPPAAA